MPSAPFSTNVNNALAEVPSEKAKRLRRRRRPAAHEQRQAFSQEKRRTEKVRFQDTVAGFVVGQCQGFDVLADWTALLTATIVYDKSGQVVQQIQSYRVIGEDRYYNSANPNKEVNGGPGENEESRLDAATGLIFFSGLSWKIRLPGYGLIFEETGHMVLDTTTGQWLSDAGHNRSVDQDLAALCNYLK